MNAISAISPCTSVIDIHQTRSDSFFDAIVLASAHAAGCNVLWTDGMNAGEVLHGVSMANPFSADLLG